jgi:hypothetical protein
MRRLCLLHFVANALLLWLGYDWLGVAESTQARLVFSALYALVLLAVVCWLYGATFVYFRRGSGIVACLRTALRHLAPLVAGAVLVLVVYGLVSWAASSAAQPAFKIASWLTLHLRKPVKPAAVARVFQAAFWVIRWIVLPVALLPMASALAARGWRGFSAFTWRSSWRYWIAVPLLLLAGLQLPFLLLRWIPRFEAFAMQFASFSLRMLAGYLLFVAAVLMLAYATSRGRPELSQPSTAVGP